MKAKELRDLIDFISSTGLEEVNIETQEFKIRVKRSQEVIAASAPASVASSPQPLSSAPASQPSSESKEGTTEKEAATDTSNYVEIKSPMIGTFYRSPNPDSPAFVNVGDKVNQGDTVCIVEAMKLFNEIESEVSGTIVKVLIENASPVEYDQPLFLVDPS